MEKTLQINSPYLILPKKKKQIKKDKCTLSLAWCPILGINIYYIYWGRVILCAGKSFHVLRSGNKGLCEISNFTFYICSYIFSHFFYWGIFRKCVARNFSQLYIDGWWEIKVDLKLQALALKICLEHHWRGAVAAQGEWRCRGTDCTFNILP